MNTRSYQRSLNKTKEDKDILYQQLIKLGDMMGDGLYLEPDGRWIEKEYKLICLLLGLTEKRDNKSIDKFMKDRVSKVKCSCDSELKQSRKGSFIGICISCGKKYKLGVKR